MTAPLQNIRRALVVGTGVSARAAITQLVRFGVHVDVVDEHITADAAAHVTALGADVIDGPVIEAFLSGALEYNLVIPSPGVPETHPVFRAAHAVDVPVWSEPELASRLFPRRTIGITGTNGKTTTTELVAEMLNASGITAHACGNIGPAVCDVAASSDVDDVLVMELSSFQLRFASTLTPSIAVVLNLAVDHLDWHPSFGAYAAAKAQMFTGQSPKDFAVANADDPATHELANQGGTCVMFSGVNPVATGVGVEDGTLVARFGETQFPVLATADIARGDAANHVVANVAAAATASLLAGATVEAVAAVARAFTPGAHRLQLVATDRNQVRYINDSKATNAHAAIAALRAVGRCVWLAGGVSKNASLSALHDALHDVDAAVVFGQAAKDLAQVCTEAGVVVHQVETLQDAVTRAATLAQPGTAVLLAPACASFDQFADYRDRGEAFTRYATAACMESKENDGAA